MGNLYEPSQMNPRFSFPSPVHSTHIPSPPVTPPSTRNIKLGHRHTQSLFNQVYLSPPTSFRITPPRSKPTLAMTLQIHAPSPLNNAPLHIHSPRPSSPSPRRNSHQQHQDHIARPSSRSERLLRDTLMRDEQERHAVPPLPPTLAASSTRPTQHRPRQSSYSHEQNHGYDSGDEEPWMRGTFLFRTPMAGPGLVRNKSAGHSYHSPPREHKSRATSPSPSSNRQHLKRSPNSMPTSIPRTTTDSASRSRSHSQSNSMSSLPPAAAACTLTPHEAVLRSRLEKVLSMGRDEVEREGERRRRAATTAADDWLLGHDWTSSPSSTGSSSNSPIDGSSPIPHHMTLPPSSPCPPRRHRHLPLTPPDSPAFDARTASALCRQMEGYVSFANVEGLGEPAGSDEEVAEECEEHLGSGGLKHGLERLWRVWGREKEAR